MADRVVCRYADHRGDHVLALALLGRRLGWPDPGGDWVAGQPDAGRLGALPTGAHGRTGRLDADGVSLGKGPLSREQICLDSRSSEPDTTSPGRPCRTTPSRASWTRATNGFSRGPVFASATTPPRGSGRATWPSKPANARSTPREFARRRSTT